MFLCVCVLVSSVCFFGSGFLLQKELELALGIGRCAVNSPARGTEGVFVTSLGEPQFLLVLVLWRAWKLSDWFFCSGSSKQYRRNSMLTTFSSGTSVSVCECLCPCCFMVDLLKFI